MCSLSTFTLFAITITLGFATPAPRSDVWTGGRLTEDDDVKCHTLPKIVSDYCGYNTTVLPNGRGHTTVSEALGEFDDFATLLTSSPCSDSIGVLLCFFYFPFFSESSGRECGDKHATVVPCRDTCEAAKNEACTRVINQYIVGGWAALPHLNCTNFYTLSDGVCSDHRATIRKNFSPSSEVSTYPSSTEALTTSKPPPATTSKLPPATTSKPPPATTSKPPPTQAPTVEVPQCPGVCKIRGAANSKTFIRNEQYSFAIKASITSKMGTTYQVAVEESYDVKTCIDGEMMDPIDIPAAITITSCKDLSSKMNKYVLIAGTYTGTSDDYKFHVGCTKSTGLVGKYRSGVPGWVDNGNSERESSC